MRLYLSSFRNGNKPKELLKLVGAGRRAALIGNAMDMVYEAERSASISEELDRLRGIGLIPVEIDLRKYFGKTKELKQTLMNFNLVWVRGGNTFVLRRALKMSGADEIIRELLEKDAMVYGGYSAGICILTPTLRGLELVDDADFVPDGYDSEIIWDGLGIVPYSIAPHYKSDHPESPAIDNTVEYFKEKNMPFKTLRDGEAIVIDGDKEQVVR